MEQLPQDWSVSATLYGVNSANFLNGSKPVDSYQTLDARVAKESIRLLELPAAAHENVMGKNLLRLLKLAP